MKSWHDPPPRTWNGARWFFVLLFMLLAGVCAWLILHGALMEHPAAPLLVIPAAMSFGALGIAVRLGQGFSAYPHFAAGVLMRAPNNAVNRTVTLGVGHLLVSEVLFVVSAAILGWLAGKAFRYLQSWQQAGSLSPPHVATFAASLSMAFAFAWFIGKSQRFGIGEASLIMGSLALLGTFLWSAKLLAALRH